MKKKILFILLCLVSFVSFVSASTETYERNPDKNYNSKKIEIETSKQRERVKNTPYVDASEKIYDFALVLTDEEEQQLYKKIIDFIDKYDTELIIVTVNMPYYYDSKNEEYAADFYDYNDFGLKFDNYSGIVLLYNDYKDQEYYNMYTFGNAQLYFGNSRYDTALDEIINDLRADNFYKAFDKFVERMFYYYKQGIDSDLKNYRIDKNGDLYLRYTYPVLPSIIISLIATAIALSVMIRKNKMVRKAYYATEYLDKNSINYRKQLDNFIRTHTSKTYIPPASTSSGSSGRSGGSYHSSSGSSGRGHSSGGGRHL